MADQLWLRTRIREEEEEEACVKAGGGHLSNVFDFDIAFAAITTTFLAVVDQSNSCTLIGRFGSFAVVSYDFVLCNAC